MTFSNILKQELLKYNLLNHPFYQMWNEGKISLSTLVEYAKQYNFQVDALPTYISRTHSITSNPEFRKILTENLADEELSEEDHLSLWKKFALTGLPVTKEEFENAKISASMKALVETCRFYANKSSAAGFGVLYAQEHNYANIAASKREGLEKHYKISPQSEGVKFFQVHEKADVWHSQQIEKLLDTLSEKEAIEAKEAGIEVMKSLNGFLDSMLALEPNSYTDVVGKLV